MGFSVQARFSVSCCCCGDRMHSGSVTLLPVVACCRKKRGDEITLEWFYVDHRTD